MDSTTAVKRLNSSDQKQILPPNNKKKIKKKRKRKESEQSLVKKKSTRPQKYIYFLDKPLEKILIRFKIFHHIPIFITNNCFKLNFISDMNGYLLNSPQSYFQMVHNLVQLLKRQIYKIQILNQILESKILQSQQE